MRVIANTSSDQPSRLSNSSTPAATPSCVALLEAKLSTPTAKPFSLSPFNVWTPRSADRRLESSESCGNPTGQGVCPARPAALHVAQAVELTGMAPAAQAELASLSASEQAPQAESPPSTAASMRPL